MPAAWRQGRVCKYCYLQARLRTGTCADCGGLTSLPGLNAGGQPTCTRCSGIPARFRCGCGREVTAGERGRCWWCVLAEVVTYVLGGWLIVILSRLGIPARASRLAAWHQLVRQGPPAVLADALGVSPATATRHALLAGADWATYASRRSSLATPEYDGLLVKRSL